MLYTIQRLIADKAHFMVFNGTYDPNTTHVHIKLSVSGTEMEIKENGKDGVEVILQRAYERYLRLTDAAPELVPHRLPPPSEPEQTEEPSYTEYTEIEEPASATNGALPTIPKDDIPF